jgi:hypothetical protein
MSELSLGVTDFPIIDVISVVYGYADALGIDLLGPLIIGFP